MREHPIIMGAESVCPRCGTSNCDNWPLMMGDTVQMGGCQDCWEAECDAEWWRAMAVMQDYYEREEKP